MNAFIRDCRAADTPALLVVAPGIPRRFLATGLGLLAAIPAVIYYKQVERGADRIIGGYGGICREFAPSSDRPAGIG